MTQSQFRMFNGILKSYKIKTVCTKKKLFIVQQQQLNFI